MLVTTIWMLAADHRREWKDYQRKFQHGSRPGPRRPASARKKAASTTKSWPRRTSCLGSQPPRGARRRRWSISFEDEVAADAERRKDDKRRQRAEFRADRTRPTTALQSAPEDREAGGRARSFSSSCRNSSIRREFREDRLASTQEVHRRRLRRGPQRVRAGRGQRIAQVRGSTTHARASHRAAQAKSTKPRSSCKTPPTHRKRLESIVGEMTADEVETRKKQLDELIGTLTQLEKQLYERENQRDEGSHRAADHRRLRAQ